MNYRFFLFVFLLFSSWENVFARDICSNNHYCLAKIQTMAITEKDAKPMQSVGVTLGWGTTKNSRLFKNMSGEIEFGHTLSGGEYDRQLQGGVTEEGKYEIGYLAGNIVDHIALYKSKYFFQYKLGLAYMSVDRTGTIRQDFVPGSISDNNASSGAVASAGIGLAYTTRTLSMGFELSSFLNNANYVSLYMVIPK